MLDHPHRYPATLVQGPLQLWSKVPYNFGPRYLATLVQRILQLWFKVHCHFGPEVFLVTH